MSPQRADYITDSKSLLALRPSIAYGLLPVGIVSEPSLLWGLVANYLFQEIFQQFTRFAIPVLKYRRNFLRTLSNSQIGHIKVIDKLLEALVSIILGRLDVMPIFNIVPPKPVHPHKSVSNSCGSALTIRSFNLCVSTKPDYLLPIALQYRYASFHLYINNRCTLLHGDSRYRIVKLFSGS